MQRTLTTLILIFVLTIGALAQDTKKEKEEHVTHVHPHVADHMTHAAVDSLHAVALYADSTFYHDVGVYGKDLSFPVSKPGTYLLSLTAEGYEPKIVPIEIKKIYKLENHMNLKTVYMKKLPKMEEIALDEVEVKATKLKFYMDGDTLVYNADAFNLSEGSMLEALVRKLPGVELSKDGVITVNGRKVESMLLNGKDFFDKDRELLLENMPAYIVKNLKAYERVPIEKQGTIEESTAKKELVLDVRLKRDYNSGWMANADVGGGMPMHNSQDKDGEIYDRLYMARLFGMRFSDNSRLMLYANANNVNDNNTPGHRGDWSPLNMTTGVHERRNAGVAYQLGEYSKQLYSIDAKASWSEGTDITKSSSQTFYNGGDMFSRSYSNSKSNDISLSARQEFYLSRREETSWYRSLNVFISPDIRYSKKTHNSLNASALLNRNVTDMLGKEWVDSIMAPNAGQTLRRYAVNRTQSAMNAETENTEFFGRAGIGYEIPHNDRIRLSLDLHNQYQKNTMWQYHHNDIDYFSNPDNNKDFRNQYNPNSSKARMYTATPSVTAYLDTDKHHNISLMGLFSYRNSESSNYFYMLNKLPGWDNKYEHELGALPSEVEMLSTMDINNSSRYKETDKSFGADFSYTYNFDKDNAHSYISFSLIEQFGNKKMDYWQGEQADTTVHRNLRGFMPHLFYYYSDYSRGRRIQIMASSTKLLAPLQELVNVRNTNDPLNIRLSNPNLKDGRSYSLNAEYNDRFGKTMVNSSIRTRIDQNRVASGYVIDRNTGIRTTMPENVNGNWNANMKGGIDFPLCKSEKWRMKEDIEYTFTNSVDLYGTNDDVKAQRSVVKNNYVKDGTRLTWRPNDKMEFEAKGGLIWQHSTSKRKDFTTINVYTYDYGMTAQMELTWKLHLSTDLTMYSRRGYSDKSFNTNELVWNARLSRPFHISGVGNFSVMFDGLDILGNLSSVRTTINAQGKTETYQNMIPSYGMLHIVYKFNKEPKKQ